MSNPRYKYFNQLRFTAGDEEQFMETIDYSPIKSIGSETSDIHSNTTTIDTFRYILHKFKKGIYVKIIDNKVVTFLPFSKAKFTNEWSNRILIKGNMNTFFEKISNDAGYHFSPQNVCTNTKMWYANNPLLRYEFPITENDTDVENYYDFLNVLCSKSKVEDVEFFINRRDFPILKNDKTEPYNHIYNSEKFPLVSHSYDSYTPILSTSCIPEKFSDVLIPTGEDWARVRIKDGVKFPKYDRDLNDEFTIEWQDKFPTAVFRGSSTGIGTTINTNQRLKVSKMNNCVENTENKYIDAGITKWKNRPRKIQDEPYLTTIDIKSLPFGLSASLTPQEQSKHKYIIHIDGYVSAYRLALELNMGSVILLVESLYGYKMWFSKYLKPYIHYVPVNKDLSDLFEKVKWCREHDKECQEIVKNSRSFYTTYLTKDGILKYTSDILNSLNKRFSNYTITDFRQNLTFPLTTTLTPSLTQSTEDIILYIQPNINHSKYIRWYNKFKLYEKMKTANYNTIQSDEYTFFISRHYINKLLKHVPNFIYTYGKNMEEKIIGSQPMNEWIKTKFDIDIFTHLIYIIYLALLVADKQYNFVHNFLTPDNITLHFLEEEVEFEYEIGLEKIVKLKTSIVPIITNYSYTSVGGFSKSKSENDYKYDIYTLIISSMKLIINTEYKNIRRLINIMEIVCDTQIRTFQNIKNICNDFDAKRNLYNNIKCCINKVKFEHRFCPRISIIFNKGNIKQMYMFSKHNKETEIKHTVYTFLSPIKTLYFNSILSGKINIQLAIDKKLDKRLDKDELQMLEYLINRSTINQSEYLKKFLNT